MTVAEISRTRVTISVVAHVCAGSPDLTAAGLSVKRIAYNISPGHSGLQRRLARTTHCSITTSRDMCINHEASVN